MAFIKTILLLLMSLWGALFLYNSFLPPISTLMAARVLTLRHVERSYVPIKRISPHLVRAVIAAEDGKFCDHHGVDWKALHGVVAKVVDDDADASHGASTITMQTVKNIFLWMGHSYVRKGIEIPMALVVDAFWGKRRVMENYLNVAEFGRGIFGAEAAARHYFGKSAASLNAREAAQLTAILPNPIKRSATRPSAYVSRYTARIMARAPSADSACTR
ncbi:MAG: monofunctional biosynthetic peptidoglycan transglycosylase [Pseudomonadota bacterium]